MSDPRRPGDEDRDRDRDRSDGRRDDERDRGSARRDDYRDRDDRRRDDDYRDRHDRDPRNRARGDDGYRDRDPRVAGSTGRDDYDDRPRDRDDYSSGSRRDRYNDPRDRHEPHRPDRDYREPPPMGSYGHPQPHSQPAPHADPGYGAGPYAPPPQPYAPRRKSKATLIVSLFAGFAYAMFFILYFTGTLDRMAGRVVHFPAAMQGKWCWESSTPTDSYTMTIAGARMNWVSVQAGVTTEGSSIARGVAADVYTLQGVKSGKVSRFRMVLENPNRLAETEVQKPDGSPGDGTTSHSRKCG